MLGQSPNAKLIIQGERMRARIQFDIPLARDNYEAMTAIFEKNQQRMFTLCNNIYKPIKYV